MAQISMVLSYIFTGVEPQVWRESAAIDSNGMGLPVHCFLSIFVNEQIRCLEFSVALAAEYLQRARINNE